MHLPWTLQRGPRPSACPAPPQARAPRAGARHAHAVLVLCTAGQTEIEQRGRFSLCAGEVQLIPAYAPHQIVSSRGAEIVGIGLHAPLPEALGPLLAPFARVRDGASPIIPIPGDRQAHLLRLFEELARESTDARPHAALVGQQLLGLILAEVSRAAPEVALPPARGLVAEALSLLARRALSPLTPRDLADAVGCSPAYLSRLVSAATGKTPTALILEQRLLAAQDLLTRGFPVAEVAARVGYQDTSHFTRLFRRHTGYSPAAWLGRSQVADRSI